MSEELESLRAEVAALRAEVEDQRDRAITRRRLLTGLAGLGAAGAAGVATAAPAGAADGDALVLGQENTASSNTKLTMADGDGSTGQLEIGRTLAFLSVGATSSASGVIASPGPGGLAGVVGQTGYSHGSGVAGLADVAGGIGVVGFTQAGGPALGGQSDADGVTLLLVPAERTGPPTDMPDGLTQYTAGCISVDAQGEVWLCITSGAPGTWRRLLREDSTAGRTVPITPMRALDTRAASGRPPASPLVPGQKTGPLKGGEAVTLDLAGTGAIPTTASGVIGNLTVVKPDYSGYLVAVPSGSSSNTSALNFDAGEVVANAFTSALGPDGLTLRANGSSGRSYHLVVDITAYIT
jgi:hypothetical protein